MKLGAEHPSIQTVLSNFVELLRQTIAADRTAELSDEPLTQALLAQIRAEES